MTQTENLPMSQRRYRRIKGVRCPFCGGHDRVIGEPTFLIGTVELSTTCNTCGKSCSETYEISGYKEIK